MIEKQQMQMKVYQQKKYYYQLQMWVQVGDYVNYNAGNWTQADVNKIKASPGSPSVGLKHDLLGTAPNQFTGFTINQSRNGTATINKIHIIYGNCTKTGWRIFWHK